MTTPQIFTDPVVLQQIDRSLLLEFLQHFKADLKASNLILPSLDTSDEDFFSSFAALLSAPEALPTSMNEALRAIAELAAPENRSRLETTVFNAPVGLGLDPRSPPVRLAFHLWLWRPYQISKESGHPPEEAAAPKKSKGGPVLHLDLLRENENGKIHLAAQQIGALKICQLLAELDLASLRKSLEHDPEGFLHLLQMLPKLSQGGMACEEVGLEVARRKVKLGKAKIPPLKRGITAETLRLVEEKLHLM